MTNLQNLMDPIVTDLSVQSDVLFAPPRGSLRDVYRVALKKRSPWNKVPMPNPLWAKPIPGLQLLDEHLPLGIMLVTADHLVVNPAVGFLQAVAQTDAGFPAQILLNERVVAVTAVHALGRVQVVGPLQLDTGDRLHDVHQPVDGDQFVAAQIDRLEDFAVQYGLRAFQTIIDVHETAGLLTIAPNLDLMLSRQFGVDHLPADRRRGLFAPARPGPVWSIDIVVAGDAGGDSEILAEMTAHPFAEQFLPAVTVLGHGGISVAFLQGDHFGRELFIGSINAGGGGVEITLDAEFPRGHQEVGVDEHREHAEGAVVFDKTHAAHVGGKIVNDPGVAHGLFAGFPALQIKGQIVHSGKYLVPFLGRLEVHRPDRAIALPQE